MFFRRRKFLYCFVSFSLLFQFVEFEIFWIFVRVSCVCVLTFLARWSSSLNFQNLTKSDVKLQVSDRIYQTHAQWKTAHGSTATTAASRTSPEWNSFSWLARTSPAPIVWRRNWPVSWKLCESLLISRYSNMSWRVLGGRCTFDGKIIKKLPFEKVRNGNCVKFSWNVYKFSPIFPRKDETGASRVLLRHRRHSRRSHAATNQSDELSYAPDAVAHLDEATNREFFRFFPSFTHL